MTLNKPRSWNHWLVLTCPDLSSTGIHKGQLKTACVVALLQMLGGPPDVCSGRERMVSQLNPSCAVQLSQRQFSSRVVSSGYVSCLQYLFWMAVAANCWSPKFGSTAQGKHFALRWQRKVAKWRPPSSPLDSPKKDMMAPWRLWVSGGSPQVASSRLYTSIPWKIIFFFKINPRRGQWTHDTTLNNQRGKNQR